MNEYDNTPSGRQEKADDIAFEKHFQSHRDVPAGRNFRWWNGDQTPGVDKTYRDNFDSIFPNSPGAGL